jgi:5'-nucleotidase
VLHFGNRLEEYAMKLRHLARAAGFALVGTLVVVALTQGTAIEGAPPSTPPAVQESTTTAPARPESTTTAPTRPESTTTAPTRAESTTSAAAQAEAGTLRIMLTNDDGWSGGGLLALRDVLLSAGFQVVVFAPADNQAGTSASLTLGQPVTITQHVAGVFSVDGSPADSVEAGMSLAFPGSTPDLVIAGPNPGLNIGNAAIHSGTLGAAVTALNEGVPAIAVNTASDPDTGDADFSATNAFVISLVNALVDNAAGGELLPDGLGLSINVPVTGNDDPPAGVAITTTDRSFIDPDYAGVSLPAVGDSVDVEADVPLRPTVDPASDSAALEAGMVSITFIEGNYDTATGDTRDAEMAALAPLLTSLL